MAQPNDLVTQKEAASHIQKSVDTIRNWRKKDALKTYSKPGSRSAFVSLSQVLNVAGLQAQGHDAAPVKKGGPSRANQGIEQALQAHLASLEVQVRDLQAQRDDLTTQRDLLRQELMQAREESQALQKRLEEATAANGGIRGFLGRLRR